MEHGQTAIGGRGHHHSFLEERRVKLVAGEQLLFEKLPATGAGGQSYLRSEEEGLIARH